MPSIAPSLRPINNLDRGDALQSQQGRHITPPEPGQERHCNGDEDRNSLAAAL